MSYRDFDLPKVEQEFGISSDHTRSLFAGITPVTPSVELAGSLRVFGPLGRASSSEKARSELLVSPVLGEVWSRSNRRVAVYSGLEFNVDVSRGLNGVCDFVLGYSKQMLQIEAPVFTIVEAKKDSIVDGLGQCAAAMVAAQLFNAHKEKSHPAIYGCVTTGTAWKFLRLSQSQLDIDVDEYSINEVDKILGILLHACGVKV